MNKHKLRRLIAFGTSCPHHKLAKNQILDECKRLHNESLSLQEYIKYYFLELAPKSIASKIVAGGNKPKTLIPARIERIAEHLKYCHFMCKEVDVLREAIINAAMDVAEC